jgi:hypothetical protein
LKIPLHRKKFLNPEINLSELIRKNAGGQFREHGELVPFMFRAVVVAMDEIGGRLESPDGKPEGGNQIEVQIIDQSNTGVAQYVAKTKAGIRNPANSIRAKIITPNMDLFTSFDDLMTYWPMFPPTTSITPGEVVYVVYEDENASHGLWLCKTANNLVDANANIALMKDTLKKTPGGKKYLFGDLDFTAQDNTVPEVNSSRRTSNADKF